MKENLPPDKPLPGLLWLGTAGVALLIVGLSAILAANWHWVPLPVQIGIALLPLVAAWSLYLWMTLHRRARQVALEEVLGILWAGGVKLKYFGIALGVLIVGGLAVTVTSPHRVERVLTFLGGGNSEMDYQIENALIAIGSGGFLGVGIGNSVQATGYLPESINDSVFAILGETFGFIGLTLIVGCFGYLLFKLLKVAAHLPTEPALVVTGIWAWVAAHVIINIMAMTGLIPLTGITLPLMSYGGSSLVLIAASLGLTLQLSCYTSREEVNINEDSSSRRGVRGTHYASRRGGAGDSRRASARPHRVLDR